MNGLLPFESRIELKTETMPLALKRTLTGATMIKLTTIATLLLENTWLLISMSLNLNGSLSLCFYILRSKDH